MNDRKPNVLLLIPNLGKGGAQRIFHQHRDFLSKDFNVVSCVFNFDGAFPEEKNDNIISLDVPAGRDVFSKLLNFFRRVRRVANIKQQHNIDVTVSHLEGADYVNILSRRNDRLILWIHGTKLHDEEISGLTGTLRKKILLPWLYRRADKIACVSSGISNELKTIIPGSAQNIITIQNGVDLPVIQSKSMEPLTGNWRSLMSKYFVVVTHCRFASQKNLRALLKVISQMKDMVDLRFVFIGDGEQRDELTDLAAKLDLFAYRSWTNDAWTEDYHLYFTGQQSNPFLWLRHSKLYVLTSLWEGFPLSICEAIACGLPIVAADCPTGPKEILTLSSAGVLMPLLHEHDQRSIDLWTGALRKLIADRPALENYRKCAVENAYRFSAERSMQETIAVVKDVLK